MADQHGSRAMWSPRVRGCSHQRPWRVLATRVVPARAGVFPLLQPPRVEHARGPRACGGVPRSGPLAVGTFSWSPRVRGCSRRRSSSHHSTGVVPARAGVFPALRPRRPRPGRGPRACGGVPDCGSVTIGTTTWSPRVRGCSRCRRRHPVRGVVVPARAGVFPTATPAHSMTRCGPRACGGVPGPPSVITAATRWSPRVRGCSRGSYQFRGVDSVVPARAGVFPGRAPGIRQSPGGPRACGGAPGAARRPAAPTAWSPRVRGCSRARPFCAVVSPVVPARAFRAAVIVA